MANRISGEIRRWRLHRDIGLNLAEIARQINTVVRGWMQYYGAFYRFCTESTPVTHQLLSDALDPQEVPTAAHHQEGRGMLATHHKPASPALRPLGMGARFLVVKMTRAR